MKTESLLYRAIFLAVLAAICTLALAQAQHWAQPLIDQHRRARQDALLRQMLPEATSFRRLPPVEKGAVLGAWRAVPRGMVFLVTERGYGGQVEVLVSVEAGRVRRVRVAQAVGETPGLGSGIADEAFLRQFQGATGEQRLARLGGKGVQAVASASISSAAVVRAVNRGLAVWREVSAKP